MLHEFFGQTTYTRQSKCHTGLSRNLVATRVVTVKTFNFIDAGEVFTETAGVNKARLLLASGNSNLGWGNYTFTLSNILVEPVQSIGVHLLHLETQGNTTGYLHGIIKNTHSYISVNNRQNGMKKNLGYISSAKEKNVVQQGTISL